MVPQRPAARKTWRRPTAHTPVAPTLARGIATAGRSLRPRAITLRSRSTRSAVAASARASA